jgi:hypothetical protein
MIQLERLISMALIYNCLWSAIIWSELFARKK